MSFQRWFVLDTGALIDIEAAPRGGSRTSDAGDTTVVVAAIEHNAAVLTTDPKDLAKLAGAAEYPVRLVTV